MYKLLIVDDDHMTRNCIKNAINWNEHGIEEVKTAENGQEGVAVFDTFKPDIVLTDIKMSGISGLELLQKIRQTNSYVKVIILTEYNDFSYAQSALKLGAFDYLLKTTDANELVSAVDKAKKAIENAFEKRNLNLKFKQQLNLSLPLLKYRYLNELICGHPYPDKLIKRLEFIDTPFREGDFILVALEVDGKIELEECSEKELFIYKFGIINIIEELLSNWGICFETKNEEFIILYFCSPTISQNENKNKVLSITQDIIKAVSKIFNISVSAGISSLSHSMTEIKALYHQARKALDHRLFEGNGSIIHTDDVSHINDVSFQIDTQVQSKLISSMRVGDKRTALHSLEVIFNDLKLHRNISIHSFHKICIELLSIASRILYEFGSSMEEIFYKDFIYFEEIKKYKTFESARLWIISVYEKVSGYILSTKILRAKKTIETAKNYIDKHYTENISLNKISQLVHMSPNYFSSLFSNEMGQSLVEYLANKRIEKAKQLLGEKDLKAFEVGEKVGYDNPYYFSRIFKKYSGMSPIEYKESLCK